MRMIEQAARAIWNARLAHDGAFRGNVDKPYDELSDENKGYLYREAVAAWCQFPSPISQSVEHFHYAFNVPAPTELSEIEPEREKMRLRIDLEEFLELVDACGMDLYVHGERASLEDCAFVSNGATPDPVGIADALGDGIYVKYGHAIERGIPLDEVLREIHRANMSKLGADGKPILRHDGKIMKGPNYSPPDIARVFYGE